MKIIILILFTSICFAQSEIVVGSGNLGNGNFVIGGNVIDAELLYENKFTKGTPIPTPKPRPSRKGMKYKKSEAQKLKEENARKLKEALKIKK
jgi:hypothetical protein